MNKPTLNETLQVMALEHGSRSETDRLRDVFVDVEKALQSGVSRQSILEVLHQDGFTMSLKMFDKALYRIRKKNKQAGACLSKAESAKAKTMSPPIPELTINDTESDSEKKPHPWAHLQDHAKHTGDRRRNDFSYDPTPDPTKIYVDNPKEPPPE